MRRAHTFFYSAHTNFDVAHGFLERRTKISLVRQDFPGIFQPDFQDFFRTYRIDFQDFLWGTPEMIEVKCEGFLNTLHTFRIISLIIHCESVTSF